MHGILRPLDPVSVKIVYENKSAYVMKNEYCTYHFYYNKTNKN